MKKVYFIVFAICVAVNAMAQDKQLVALSKRSLRSKVSDIKNLDVDRALRIATYVLNSTAFRDSVLQLTFKPANYCGNNFETTVRITGKTVLDSLYRSSEVMLELVLKKYGTPPFFGKCFSLGNTHPNSAKITSYYKNIRCDMPELPFSHAYGVHIVHEYAHEVGFCHTDYKDDVAERIGMIAYHLVDRWRKQSNAEFIRILN